MMSVQWRVPSRSTNAVCTMKSPFKIIKCCLYNEETESLQDQQMLFVQWRDWVPSRSSNVVCTMKESLQDQQMLFVQWRVPSRSSNDVCTMKSPFKINKCCLYNEESLQGHQMLFVQWRIHWRSTMSFVQWVVSSRSSNVVCTMKSPFKVIICCL